MHCKNLKRNLNKLAKKISVVLLLVIIAFSFIGCINFSAKAITYDKNEITIMPYADEYGYFASIIIIDMGEDISNHLDSFFKSRLSQEFKTKPLAGYPTREIDLIDSLPKYTAYGYDIEIPKSDWFFASDPQPNIKYGLFSVNVAIDYTNPFSFMLKEGTKLNKVYNSLIYNQSGQHNEIFVNKFGTDFNTKVLLPASFLASTNTGEIVYDTKNKRNYYQFAGSLSQTNQRLEYSYKVMASYTWFALAIAIGLLTLIFVLVFLKDKKGRLVSVQNKKKSDISSIQIFEGF